MRKGIDVFLNVVQGIMNAIKEKIVNIPMKNEYEFFIGLQL